MKLNPLMEHSYFTTYLHVTTNQHVLKFGYSEKATKFEKIFHLKFDAIQ